MKSDFLESNLENAGFWGHGSAHCGLCSGPRGEVLELCRPQAVPRAAEPPNLSQAPETSNQQPWGSWVIPVTAVTRDSNSDDTCTFPEKKKLGPGTLKYITLAGSAISTVFATSPKCVFKGSFKNCFDVDLYNSDAIQQLSDDDQRCALCEIRNLKIIIKLLGLMGDETRVIHQQKINPWWNPQCWNFNGQEWSRLEEKPKPPVEEWNMIWSKMYP